MLPEENAQPTNPSTESKALPLLAVLVVVVVALAGAVVMLFTARTSGCAITWPGP